MNINISNNIINNTDSSKHTKLNKIPSIEENNNIV